MKKTTILFGIIAMMLLALPLSVNGLIANVDYCGDFDDSTADDSSTNNNDFNIISNPLFNDSDNGGLRIIFDGVDDYLNISSFMKNDSFTISGHWQFTDPAKDGNAMFLFDSGNSQGSQPRGVALFRQIGGDTNHLNPSINGVSALYMNMISPASFNSGSPPFHFILTFDNSTPIWNLTINNATEVSTQTTTASNAVVTQFRSHTIGADANGFNNAEGSLDNLVFIQGIPSQAEIEELKDMGRCEDIIVVAADTTPPTFDQDSINDSFIQRFEDITVSIFAHDETALSSVSFAHNQSGILTNVSTIAASGLDFNASFILSVINIRSHQIAYQFTINDTSGNSNQTGLFQFEVQNTPPQPATILFPTADLVTPQQPLDLNVTFAEDIDGDGLQITYYINGLLNQTSFTNTTLNASDGSFTLEVSIDDGFAATANVSVSFQIDTTNPILTITLPINNSIHITDIPVSLSCLNVNLDNLSYIFQNSSDIIQTAHNATPDPSNAATLNVPLDIGSLANGVYTLDISCLDNVSFSTNAFLTLTKDVQPPQTTSAIIIAVGTGFLVIGIIVATIAGFIKDRRSTGRSGKSKLFMIILMGLLMMPIAFAQSVFTNPLFDTVLLLVFAAAAFIIIRQMLK